MHTQDMYSKNTILNLLEGITSSKNSLQGNISSLIKHLQESHVIVHDIWQNQPISKIKSLDLPAFLLEFNFLSESDIVVSLSTTNEYFSTQMGSFNMMKNFMKNFDYVVISLRFSKENIEEEKELDSFMLSLNNESEIEENIGISEYADFTVNSSILQFHINLALENNDKESFMKYSSELNDLKSNYHMQYV